MSRRILFLLALCGVMVAILQTKPIRDTDLFWQIQSGRIMLERGRIETRDVLTYTHRGESVPPIGWLAQVFVAEIYELGSWPAVRAVHAALFAGAFLIAGWTARREETSLVGVGMAVVLGFVASLSNCQARPQSVAFCGFAAVLALARDGTRVSARLAVAAAVLILWQNAHPSVAVGVVALVALAGAGWVEFLRRPDRGWPIIPTFLVILAGVCQFATPLGLDVLAVSRANYVVSRLWLGIYEWMPAWDASVRGALGGFWIALVISLILLVRVGRRARISELATLAVMTTLALLSVRLVVFWALALVPIWARWMESVRPEGLLEDRGERRIGRVTAVVTILCLGLLAVAPAVPGLLGRRSILFHEIPMVGLRRLRESLPEGRVYNYHVWSGPLILEGWPRWSVAIDGRLYVYNRREEWTRYFSEARGEVPLAEIERRHRPDAFVLHPGFQRELARQLQKSEGWREIHGDRNCRVFVRQRSVSRRVNSDRHSPG